MDDNPCIKCGLCCIFYPTVNKAIGQWGNIFNDEVDNIPRKLYSITRKPVINDFYKEYKINKFIKDKKDPDWKGFKRCVALEGTARDNVSCNVYKTRPRICSEFEVGGTKCNSIRKWGGLDPIKKN